MQAHDTTLVALTLHHMSPTTLKQSNSSSLQPQPNRSYVMDSVIDRFVQMRGSIPVGWSQTINMKYTPHLAIASDSSGVGNMSVHFERLVKEYGGVVVANLVNGHGYEQPLNTYFSNAMSDLQNPRVKYVSSLTTHESHAYFDFHKECKNMQWQNVEKLYQRCEREVEAFAYFGRDTVQTGVLRTNCMDCLDRTNVVQSVFAKHVPLIVIHS